VIDTQNLFAAQGVMAVEAVRSARRRRRHAEDRARLENLALHTQGFLIPRDLNYMRERTRVRGDPQRELPRREARHCVRHQADPALQPR
jgi:fatty acid-binding protein DegV